MMEGAYPSPPPSSGYVIAPGTFQSGDYKVELDHEDYPLAAFAGAYSLLIESTGFVQAEPRVNKRAGVARKRATIKLRIGYVIGQDSAQADSGGVTAEQAARVSAADDAHMIAMVLSEPSNWGGLTPPMYSVRQSSDTTYARVVDGQRLLSETLYEVEVGYVPGTAY